MKVTILREHEIRECVGYLPAPPQHCQNQSRMAAIFVATIFGLAFWTTDLEHLDEILLRGIC